MANPLLNFIQNVTSMLSAKKESPSVVGIDIGSSSIKVVQLKNKGGSAVLETYGEIALGPYANTEIGRSTNLPADKIAQALTDVLKESNVTTRSAAVAIPFASSLLSLIEMPKVSEKQLDQMVPLEARKYIPVPITEVTLDWFVIPDEEKIETAGDEAEEVNPKKSIDVLLVAIHNDIISKYESIVKAAGLSTSFFEIEVFSSVRSVLERGIAPVGVLDIGAANTKFYIVEHGVIRESHIINRGAQDITLAISKSLNMSVARAEEMKRQFGLSGGEGDAGRLKDVAHLTLDFIFSEVNRSLLNYQTKRHKNVGSVVLTGGGAALPGILPLATERLSVEATLGNPFSKTDAPAFLEKTLHTAGPEFAVAVGVALRKLQEEK